MQNDTLTALLLDPFITFEEAVRQANATPPVTPRPQATPATMNRPPQVFRPSPRTCVRSSPVVHHLPVVAG